MALVGCGAVTQLYYAPALAELQQAGYLQVVAAVDTDPVRAAKVARHFNSCRTVGDISSLPREESMLAVVSSPNHLHSSQSIQLLRSGISVLVEKPMAVRVDDAREMIAESQKSGCVLAVSLVRRFFPSSQLIKKIIASKLLGAISSFEFNECHPFDWPVQTPALFDRQLAGGGILIDIGSHVLDLLCFWFGEPSELSYEDDSMGGVEANCLVTATFAEGFCGKIRLSREGPGSTRYKIDFERGSIAFNPSSANALDLQFDDLDVALLCQIHQLLAGSRGQVSRDFPQSFAEMLINVTRAVDSKTSVLVPGEEGIKSLSVIEKCYQRRQLIPMPWLTKEELAAAARLNAGPR